MVQMMVYVVIDNTIDLLIDHFATVKNDPGDEYEHLIDRALSVIVKSDDQSDLYCSNNTMSERTIL